MTKIKVTQAGVDFKNIIFALIARTLSGIRLKIISEKRKVIIIAIIMAIKL